MLVLSRTMALFQHAFTSHNESSLTPSMVSQLRPDIVFLVSIGLVGAIIVSLLLLALRFGHGRSSATLPRSGVDSRNGPVGGNGWACNFHQPLSSYVNFVSGMLYIPLLSLLSLFAIEAIERCEQKITFGDMGRAAGAIACLAFLVPFCLFVSQNQGYIRDEHAFHLLKVRALDAITG